MPLREALRMGLESSTSVRVTFAGDRNESFTPSCWGGRRKSRTGKNALDRNSPIEHPLWSNRSTPMPRIARTKSEAMATVRSVERLYWSLAAAHAGLWAADRAVQLATEVVEIEETDEDLGLGTDSNQLADAIRRLKQFQQDLVARTSDVVEAERQLRQLIGARIRQTAVHSRQPTDRGALVFAWGTYLESVLTKRPDVLRVEGPLP